MNKTIKPGDDVQQAINGCSSGDVLTLSDGRYSLPNVLNMRSGVALSGPGATITGGSDSFMISLENTDGAQILGVTLDSPRKTCIKASGSRHALIKGITTRNVPERAIDFFGGMSASVITENNFLDNHGDGAILGWNAGAGCIVTRNNVDNAHEGFHFFWGGNRGVPDNCVIQYNKFSRIHHFALEQQGNPLGLDIGYNWVDDWQAADSQMGFSIATGGDHGGIAENPPDTARGVKVHDCYIGGDGLRSSGQDAYTALEIMGWDTEACYCLFRGRWNAVALAGLNSPNMKLYQIWACGFNNTHANTQGIAPEDRFVNLNPANLHDVRFLDLNAMPRPTYEQVCSGDLPWQSKAGGAAIVSPIVIDSTPPDSIIKNFKGGVTADKTLTWTWDPVQRDLRYTCGATRGTQVLGQGTVPAGTGKVSLAGVPDQWEVTCALFADAAAVASLNVQYKDELVPAAVADPVVPDAPADPEVPAAMELLLKLHSDDGGKTWTAVKAG